ncbi:hypothetical protein [Pseudomonas sp. KCJK8927]|uniref:hypothetical protein n=1 Tax=Pseudomonas sp. KCJK8927 TaxID=3344560 RepID=UPI0039058FFC
MTTKKNAAAPEASAVVTFCDKTHASRSLFLANGRELQVTRARLEVAPEDTEALAYLDARGDFERLTPAE